MTGKLLDFALLSDDRLAIDPKRLPQIEVRQILGRWRAGVARRGGSATTLDKTTRAANLPPTLNAAPE